MPLSDRLEGSGLIFIRGNDSRQMAHTAQRWVWSTKNESRHVESGLGCLVCLVEGGNTGHRSCLSVDSTPVPAELSQFLGKTLIPVQ